MASEATMLTVPGPHGDREVRISSPSRVVFPEPGITKLDLAQYIVDGRRRLRRGERRPARVAAALRRRHRRRPVLLEEPAQGCSRLRALGARRLSERPIASAARHRRAGRRRLGRADEHHRLPPVGVARRGLRQPRRVAHRPRPAARHRLRRCQGGRRRAAGGARRRRAHGLHQDLGQSRPARLRPDRADARVPRGSARGHRRRPRTGATDAGCRDHGVVEGGARRAHLRGLQPGQPRSHHGRRLQSRVPSRTLRSPARSPGTSWRMPTRAISPC